MSTHSIATTRQVDGRLLRFSLLADGASTAANALIYMAGAVVLDSWLGLPTGMLIAVGAALAVYGGLVLRLATRAAMPRVAVVGVIAANVLWVVDSFLALGLDWFTPTTAGEVVIAVQAVAVAALAALQYAGLRRAA